MARPPVQRSGGASLLRPQAAPVDTFVNPGPNRLASAAEDLAKLGGSLQALIAQRQEKQNEDDAAKAEVDFVTQNGHTLAEGVREGLIPAHQSHGYVEGWKRAQGSNLGARMRLEFNAAYDAWEGKNEADADGYAAFVSKFASGYIGKQSDPKVLKGLIPQLRALQEEGYRKHTEYRNGITLDGNIKAHVAEVNAGIAEESERGQHSADGMDYAKVTEAALAQRQKLIDLGTPPDKVDDYLMKNMANQAILRGDLDMLRSFFSAKVPGKDYTYASTPEGLALYRTTEDAIEADLGAKETGARVAQERADKKLRDETTASIIGTLMENPEGEIDEETLKSARKGNPNVDIDILDWRKKLKETGQQSDPDALREVDNQILDGEGMAAVLRANKAGVFANGEDLRKAITLANTLEDKKGEVDDIMKGPEAKAVIDSLMDATAIRNEFTGASLGTTREGLEARYDFRRKVLEWTIANPNADILARDEAIAKIGERIMSRIVPSADPLQGGGTYERPKGEGGKNPYTDPKAEGEEADPVFSIEPGAPTPFRDKPLTPTTEPDPEATAPEAPDTQGLLEGMTDVQRQALEAQAAEEGVTVEEFLNQAAPAQAEQPNASPINYVPPRAGDETVLRAFAVQGAQRPDSFSGMNPEFSGGLQTMFQSAPPEIQAGLRIMSGYRSVARQTELWNAALKKYGSPAAARKWVAPPGSSGHNHGHAADLKFTTKAAREWAHANAGKFGLKFPLGNEPWHIELASARGGGGGKGFKMAQGPKGMAALVNRQDAPSAPTESFTADNAKEYLDAVNMMPAFDFDDYEGSAATGDPRTDRLLNLIGQGEAGNNYNAVFGNSASEVDLGAYTLEQLMAIQERAVAAGSPSSAIGKYMLLRKTIAGVIPEMGLTGKEKFNAKLQDRIAVHLLERRGYREWEAGKLSTKQFARRMAQEWAAMPELDTGKSYYDGDGLNKSRVKPREVYAALGLAT